jgi:hypothetical protein
MRLGAYKRAFFTLKTSNGYTPGFTNQKNLASFGEEKHYGFVLDVTPLSAALLVAFGFRRQWDEQYPRLDSKHGIGGM